MSISGGTDSVLQTISVDGRVPETRMLSASMACDFWQRLRDNDTKRDRKRSLVNGLVDGNPPYRTSKLRDAGMAQNINANFGSARMYMESGVGAFYDLATEAPGFIGILTTHGKDEHDRDEYSRIMSAEADRILLNDPVWDYEIQQSQWNMVLHGCGPLLFEGPYKVLPRAVSCGDLKVPERTKSDVKYWDVFTAEVCYYPPELFEFIKDEEAAAQVGWDIEYTKKVIINAMDVRQPDNRVLDWTFYQQELKNNSLAYYDDSKVCYLVHICFKEFSGKVSNVIIQRDVGTAEGDGGPQYLFQHIARYDNFYQCLHPMYFDRGNGGYHHSVTGLGVKMYSAMEAENRLFCNLYDKAFAPKILFKPTSSESRQRLNITTIGDYGSVPANWDAIQVPIQGFLTDGLAMVKASSEMMRNNLSSYRQNAPMKQEGNPVTRAQVLYDASQQSTLSKTTYNRYYRQMDLLYAEIVRRMCDLNTTDDRAKEFQKRCVERGVPRECFGRIDQVRAVRVIGQGSAFMRKQSVDSLAQWVGSMPEDGQRNWLNDKIACEAGQDAVKRYNPKSDKVLPDDQQFWALQGITDMKVGVAPIITRSQNPLTFAAAYLTAAVQSFQSLQKGADEQEVLRFLELAGPAILAHLKRFARDPIRHVVWKQIFKQWQQLAKLTDELKRRVQQKAQQQAKLKQKEQASISEQAIRAKEAQADIALRAQKQRALLQLKAADTRQRMALADASTASNIRRQHLQAFSDQ